MYSLNLKVFFSYVQSDRMHKAGLWDVHMQSEIVKPILKSVYYSFSVYGYYLLL